MLPTFKGVPQAQYLVLSYLFCYKRSVLFCKKNVSMYNYADDRTLSKSDKTLEKSNFCFRGRQ